jgi:TPR repeat protein
LGFALLQRVERDLAAQMKNRSFSQEMASSSSSHKINLPLSTLLEWHKIRDTFFGENFVSQNILLAIELSASCQHPDARWLTEACAGKDVRTKENAKEVFSALGQNDARALCFAWLLGEMPERVNLAPLRRSAELSCAFARALMAGWTEGDERLRFAVLAAEQGERDGFYWLGRCLQDGEGCEENLDEAKQNFLNASELGHGWAVRLLGGLLAESDSQQWLWWGRAAALGNSWTFLLEFAKQVELFNAGCESDVVMFAIGQSLQEHVNEESRTIFNNHHLFESRIGPAKQAIAFYESQIQATKDAMHAWTQVGLRFKVVKDVRKLIAKLIWDSRMEALFDVSARRLNEAAQEVQPSARAVRAQKRALK